MCNCQSMAHFGFGFYYCLPPTSASSQVSQAEGALESPASPPRRNNQAHAREPFPDNGLEATSDADDNVSTAITDLFSVLDNDAGTDMDVGTVVKDRELVDNTIHRRFRQLNSAPVFATIPAYALLSHLNGLANPPPTSPLPPHFSTTMNFDYLLRPYAPTVHPSLRHFSPPAPTSGGPPVENRAFPTLTVENNYVRYLQETDVQWSSALGEARAGNAGRRRGELWGVYGNEGRFVNGWFVSRDSAGEALEPLELEA